MTSFTEGIGSHRSSSFEFAPSLAFPVQEPLALVPEHWSGPSLPFNIALIATDHCKGKSYHAPFITAPHEQISSQMHPD